MCSYCTTPVYNGNNTLGGYTCITCRAWVPYNSLHDARTAPVIDGRDDDRKFVRVKGTVLERSGLHAITIASIEEVLGIHLITDAQ